MPKRIKQRSHRERRASRSYLFDVPNRVERLDFDVESLEDRRLLTVILDGGFENNSAGNWYGLGGSLIVSDQAAHSGGSSALATNRAVDWNGIGRNVLGTLELDKDYKFTTYVRLANPGSETVFFGVAQTDGRGTVFDTMRETTVTANEWTKLDGGFRFASVGGTTDLSIYIGGPTPGVDFYIDDFTIDEYDWRADTNARIEQVRKSNATINVFDQFGNAFNDVTIEVRQLSPSIELGSSFMPLQIDNKVYRDFFLDHFEQATVEAFGHWSDQEGVRGQPDFSVTDEVANFFRVSGLKGHGHTIFFGDADTRPAWLDNISDQQLFQEMIQRVNEVVTRYSDVFERWDVNNEMVKVQYFEERLGDWIQAWMFSEARSRDPNAQLFLNEFSAIASGERIDDYVSLIDDLLSRGAPVGAIGFQSHFNHTVSSWDIQTSVAHFDDYGIPLYSTEFDVVNPSDFERAKDLEVFFRTVMAMPEFAGVTLWGFWEGSHWRGPDASLFELDWTPNESGQMYLDLWNEWSTEVTGSTGSDNRFDFRGYHGEYEVLVSRAGLPTEKHSITLDRANPQASFDLVLPTRAAHETGVASRDIQVRAAGSTGSETMQLLIDGQVVKTWTNIRGNANNRQFIIRNYTHNEAVTADRVRVAFVNDGIQNGRNRDLTVNQIRLGGIIHESESPNVLSVGSWQNGNCDAGFKHSETLHCNGYFQFGGTAIDIFAAGATGEELIELQIRGETVAQFQVTGGNFSGNDFQQFSYIVGSDVRPDEIRVAFVNDGTTANGADRNVRIDKIRVDGVALESEAAGTLSLGSWNGVDCGLGYRQSDTLFCGGYFQYGHTVIEVLAEGDTGEENMQLLVDGNVVREWQGVAADFGGIRRQAYSYVHAATLGPDQVTVAFVNDGTASSGADKNLRVDRIALNGTVYESESPNTFSTGAWDAGSGCAPGFKQSETLNCNGSFTYGTVVGSAQVQRLALDAPVYDQELDETRFYVVDASSDQAERFTANRLDQSSMALEGLNKNARGVAADATGANYWVVDRTGEIFVYAASGVLEGSWNADGVRSAQGIATDGQSIWIVDARRDEVHFFADAAAWRQGEHTATSTFDLVDAKRATGITTDGESLWIVNSASKDSVYRYALDGSLVSTWQLDRTNSNPTGITIDPINVDNVWVVDARRDEVFEYAHAAYLDDQVAKVNVRWHLAGRNPQGIADPPPIAGAPDIPAINESPPTAVQVDPIRTDAQTLSLVELQAATLIRVPSEFPVLEWTRFVRLPFTGDVEENSLLDRR